MVENLSCVVQHSSQQHPQSHPNLWHWVEADHQIARTVAWTRRCGTACGNDPQGKAAGYPSNEPKPHPRGQTELEGGWFLCFPNCWLQGV